MSMIKCYEDLPFTEKVSEMINSKTNSMHQVDDVIIVTYEDGKQWVEVSVDGCFTACYLIGERPSYQEDWFKIEIDCDKDYILAKEVDLFLECMMLSGAILTLANDYLSKIKDNE